jgi:Flp pilus assembly protein TadG
MLALLTSSVGKYVAIVLAVVAVLFGAYEYGSSHGYKSGYQVAWDTQQKAINNMVAAQNAETQAQNTKITTLEQSAADAWQTAQNQQKFVVTQRNTEVAAYQKANPQVAASCGFAPATVNVINQMLGVQ